MARFVRGEFGVAWFEEPRPSLAVPWGIARGDDPGGYHLVWPRDLTEAMGGFLALGDHSQACRILEYLRRRQQPDGHWVQNMWVDGTPYRESVQMDETALPILAVQLARDKGWNGPT